MKSLYACNSSIQCLSGTCNQTTSTCACPTGSVQYSNKCYKFFNGNYKNDNSDEAQDKCSSEGGFLMSVNNSFDFNLFSSILTPSGTWVNFFNN
jgi:hypothetical protein